MNNLPVVILCGGRGARINEETIYRPKPMVEIGDKPILWHIMKIYARYNFKKFILCLGYKSEVIKSYFLNYRALTNDCTINIGKDHVHVYDQHDEDDWEITLADTGLTSMTGARIKKIEKYIDTDNFLLTYGDGVADINIDELTSYHQSHGKIGTICGVHSHSRFGELAITHGQVTRFNEKPLTSGEEGLINGGFFMFKKEIFRYLDDKEDCVLELSPLEKLASDGELMVYHHKGFWHCMDTYRDKQILDEMWLSGTAKWKMWR